MGSPVLRSDKIRETLAHNMTALCEELQISENELARRSGVSQKQVNNIVNARTGCGVDALDAIARAASLPPWLLLCPFFKLIVRWAARFDRVVSAYAGLSSSEREAVDTVVLGMSSRKGVA